MKSQSHEQGSAVAIAIVSVLTLALLGALGFIFWQNFINKSDSPSSDTTSKQSADNDSGKRPESASYLPIDDWGIKLKLNDSLLADDFTVGDPTAEDRQQKIASIVITYKPADKVYQSCGETVLVRSSDKFASVGPASPPNSKGSVNLGSYSYAIAPSQNACYDGAPTDQWDSLEKKLEALPNTGWPTLNDLQLQ